MKNPLIPKRIKPLDIEIYKLGICFLCNLPCQKFVHRECAIAYSRHKEFKQMEENINSGN
jgi:hypothetical protein